MSLLYFRIDRNAIQKALEERVAFAPQVQVKANLIVANLFGRASQSLMKNFLEHPVTQELKAGASDPDTANISGTTNGEGNLFGFLGFWQGQDPTEELEKLLGEIDYEKSSTKRNIIDYKITNYPTKSEISEATELNWGDNGVGWAFAVENGDFGGGAALSHFIVRAWSGSRSQSGFQIKDQYSEENFSPTPYITEILKNFRNRINNSSSKFLA